MFKTIFSLLFVCFSLNINDVSPIAGGDFAKPHQAPWQVYQYPEICPGICTAGGGAIIHKKAVLTSASNCAFTKVEDFRVTYGGVDRFKLNTTKITKQIIHPKWNRFTDDNNVCVIILATEVIFSDDAKLIEIADKAPEPNTVADIYGYGMVAWPSSSLSRQLKHANLTIISNKECNQTYGAVNTITDNMLCTKNSTFASPLPGDNGGALVVDNKLVGVLSHEIHGFGGTKFPAVYTNAAVVKTWILEQIKKYA